MTQFSFKKVLYGDVCIMSKFYDEILLEKI